MLALWAEQRETYQFRIYPYFCSCLVIADGHNTHDCFITETPPLCPAELVYINFIVRCSFVALLIKSTHLIICGLSVTTEKSTSVVQFLVCFAILFDIL